MRRYILAGLTMAGVLALGSAVMAADENEPASTTQQAESREVARLCWAPPALENPITIELTVDGPVPRLKTDRDYIIKLPDQPRTKATSIVGGRNVVMIGGHIALENLDGQQAWDSAKRAIYIKDNQGIVHIEGVFIDGINGGEFDAVAIAAPDSIVQLQNIRVNDVRGTVKTFHGDVVQPWGGVKELRIDRMTASTHYQGLQIDKDLGPIGEQYIYNVNLTGPGNYKIWLTKYPNDNPKRVVFENVYLLPAEGRSLDRSVWPERRDQEFGAKLSEDGTYITWPNLDFVEGKVLLGNPPDGDFVPEGVAGVGYQSPGYQQP